MLKTGEFFGTLCAIDPNPAQIENEKITGMFRLFTDLIAFHLQQIDLLEQSQNLSDQLEYQVQVRTRQLQESVDDLRRSNTNLEQFAYIASHDLQEPLRKIQSFSDLLQTKRGAELGEDIDLLARMQQAAKRMSTLVKDLLAYSRISTRQEAASSVLLNQAVEGALKDLDVSIYQSRAQIDVTTLPVVQGNVGQLEQLFQNLLSNALKFHREGVPPRIRISAQTIAESELPSGVKPARKVPMYHRIEVSDEGIGFEGRYLDRVFQVFQRLHSKNAYPGTGIGLAICEKVAINHGGAITAVSQPGQGAIFQVYLPAIS
ncbi:MAG: hypothetical protein EOO88_45330 [Pedobacter sp.]|nr:MAG: hypothetical protein EOO88_45330 [Pedobacter sp.]